MTSCRWGGGGATAGRRSGPGGRVYAVATARRHAADRTPPSHCAGAVERFVHRIGARRTVSVGRESGKRTVRTYQGGGPAKQHGGKRRQPDGDGPRPMPGGSRGGPRRRDGGRAGTDRGRPSAGRRPSGERGRGTGTGNAGRERGGEGAGTGGRGEAPWEGDAAGYRRRRGPGTQPRAVGATGYRRSPGPGTRPRTGGSRLRAGRITARAHRPLGAIRRRRHVVGAVWPSGSRQDDRSRPPAPGGTGAGPHRLPDRPGRRQGGFRRGRPDPACHTRPGRG